MAGRSTEVQVLPMAPSDWGRVSAIYAEGIATGSATFEREVPSWELWDACHLPFGRLVARTATYVAGWAALSPVSRRAAYSGVAEASVYVGAAYRGLGVGTALCAALVAASEANGVWTLQAGVFPENAASLGLLARFGFREVGVRERIGRADGRWRDVVLLERRSRVAGADGPAGG